MRATGLAYLELARVKFLTMLAYRVNYWSGVIIYTINIGVYYFFWQAVYAGRQELGGLTAGQMTSYLAVAWMARAFWFNNLDRELAAEIRDGTVAVQLVRPYNYLLGKLSGALGEGVFRLLFFAVPGMAVACLLFPVRLPDRPAVWLPFALAVFMSFCVNSLLNVLTGLGAFFLLNNSGLMHAKRVAVDLLSGLYLPLSFYPEAVQAVLRWLPFQAVGYLPSLAFAGVLRGEALARALLVQAAWIAVLAVAASALWRLARRRLVVQGG